MFSFLKRKKPEHNGKYVDNLFDTIDWDHPTNIYKPKPKIEEVPPEPDEPEAAPSPEELPEPAPLRFLPPGKLITGKGLTFRQNSTNVIESGDMLSELMGEYEIPKPKKDRVRESMIEINDHITLFRDMHTSHPLDKDTTTVFFDVMKEKFDKLVILAASQ